MTGPATAGFEALATMKKAALNTSYTIVANGNFTDIELSIKNTSKQIAFFTQVQFLDKAHNPVRPSFYSDNFCSIMPGETKHIQIETATNLLDKDGYSIVTKGYNVLPTIIQLPKTN
jgi:mannosylglycoprotein endo-beta-mannosidase